MYKRNNSEISFTKPIKAPEMPELPIPDFSWANLESYFNPVSVLPIQFSRGCKWRKCRFCAHNFSFGRYRCIDPIKAVDQLIVTYFYITDQYLDGTFLEPFSKELISRNLNIKYTFMGRPAEDTYTFLQENREWIHSHTSSEFQLYSGTPFGNNPEKYGVKITGKSIFCKINGFDLESVKKEHTNVATSEEPEILRGPLEAKKWKRRKVLLYSDNFWNSLPSEHYLILTADIFDMNFPNNPLPENRAS